MFYLKLSFPTPRECTSAVLRGNSYIMNTYLVPLCQWGEDNVLHMSKMSIVENVVNKKKIKKNVQSLYQKPGIISGLLLGTTYAETATSKFPDVVKCWSTVV